MYLYNLLLKYHCTDYKVLLQTLLQILYNNQYMYHIVAIVV